MGEGNVQHQGLEDLLLARGLGEQVQVAHHLQPVRDLQQGHARVGGIADDEFLVVLGLQAGVLGLDGGDLRQALDHGQHVLREGADVHLWVEAGGFVQIDRRNALRAQSDFVLDDARHAVRVADERPPVPAHIVAQGFEGDPPCISDQVFHRSKDIKKVSD